MEQMILECKECSCQETCQKRLRAVILSTGGDHSHGEVSPRTIMYCPTARCDEGHPFPAIKSSYESKCTRGHVLSFASLGEQPKLRLLERRVKGTK